MLDVRTLLVVILVVAVLQGIGFLVLHRTQPGVPGLRSYGIAFIIFAMWLFPEAQKAKKDSER